MEKLSSNTRHRILALLEPKNRARYKVVSKQSLINATNASRLLHERRVVRQWKSYALRQMTMNQAFAYIMKKRRDLKVFFSYDEFVEHAISRRIRQKIPLHKNRNFQFRDYHLYDWIRLRNRTTGEFLTPKHPQFIAIEYDTQFIIFYHDKLRIIKRGGRWSVPQYREFRYEQPVKSFEQLFQKMADLYNSRIIGYHGNFKATKEQYESLPYILSFKGWNSTHGPL